MFCEEDRKERKREGEEGSEVEGFEGEDPEEGAVGEEERSDHSVVEHWPVTCSAVEPLWCNVHI